MDAGKYVNVNQYGTYVPGPSITSEPAWEQRCFGSLLYYSSCLHSKNKQNKTQNTKHLGTPYPLCSPNPILLALRNGHHLAYLSLYHNTKLSRKSKEKNGINCPISDLQMSQYHLECGEAYSEEKWPQASGCPQPGSWLLCFGLSNPG